MKAQLFQSIAVSHLKEVPEISPRKPLRVLRAAFWHFREGGLPQLRQWGSRKLGIDYAINYATALHENQRQIQDEVEDLKQKYAEKFQEVSELQKNSLRSIELGYQEKLETAKSEHVNALVQLEADSQRALAAQRAELEELRAEFTRTNDMLGRLEKENRRLKAVIFSNASLSGLSPEREVASHEFRPLVSELLTLEHTLPLVSLVEASSALNTLNLTELRQLGRTLNTAGYWRLFARVQEIIFEKSQKGSDKKALERTYSTLSAFDTPIGTINTETASSYDPSGPVIHVVGKGLLDVQTGYTLRTAYTVQAQQQLGIPTLVALQPGSSGIEVNSISRSTYNKVAYVRLPGRARSNTFLKSWLDKYVEALEELVREEHPSVLHAHSDFLNGAAAIVVGRRNHIPVIYESRGFWEESWLSRLGDRLGLGIDPHEILEPFGLPDAYSLRRRAELTVREGADAVITLADVMQEHIEKEHHPTELSSLHVVPNAVAPEEFAPRITDNELAEELGISEDAVVIGYVTSMVEYEGIDILLNGVANLHKLAPRLKIHLLLVGDGPVLERLEKLSLELGIKELVTFTGQVPHEKVGRYYSLIDIFVVPRRPTTVSQLVTPLKPFEAMAMGKAVVVSGVSALQEIAHKSQAVETFTPNDSLDLANVLHTLVVNKDKRKECGTAARNWVRKHRSWESNAQKTLEIYRSAGAVWPHITKDSPTDWVGRIARHIQTTAIPTTGWFVEGPPRDSAKTIITQGWQYSDHPRIRLDENVEWDKMPSVDRSLAFWLQTWNFIDAFFVDQRQPDLPETRFLLDVIRRWNEARLERAEAAGSDESMAYYDMALSLRAPRLLAVIRLAMEFEETHSETAWLIELLLHERQKLREKEAFNPRTNHGFYTAAAQLHLEKFLPALPDHLSVRTQANDRMNLLIASQFAEDGGHLEHSPSYHRLLLEAFISALDEGLITDENMVGRLRRAQKVMGWMIQPNGELLAMGDTEAARAPAGVATQESTTEWIRTDGKAGKPEVEELCVLPQSGYVFVRSPQPQKAGERIYSSYLALQGGFHSRAHKHADDLSFVWFDRGQEILIDAGRWGYGPLLPSDSPLRAEGFYYAAPERQYVESVHAHNTIEIDGKIHDRRRPPFGSAILGAKRVDRTFVISAEAPHSGDKHHRTLTLYPGEKLEVQDRIESGSTAQREAKIWFLLNGELELIDEDQSQPTFQLASGIRLQIRSSASCVTLTRGQQEPLLGWRATKKDGLIPAWSLGFQRKFKGTDVITSELRFLE